jgi:hypothetical protein
MATNSSNNIFTTLVRRDILNPSVANGVDGSYIAEMEPGVDGFYAAYFEMADDLKTHLFSNASNTLFTGSIPADWLLFSLIQTITLPNLQIDKKTWQGYQDQRVHYPTNLSYETDTFTLTMWDTYNCLVLNTMTSWLLYLQAQAGNPSLLTGRADLKANLVTILYDPTLLEPQMAVLFLGVFPIGVPLSSVQTDVSNIQLRTLQVNFSFDRMVCDQELLANVRTTSGFVMQLQTLLEDPTLTYLPPVKNFKIQKQQTLNAGLPANVQSFLNTQTGGF